MGAFYDKKCGLLIVDDGLSPKTVLRFFAYISETRFRLQKRISDSERASKNT